MPVIDYPRFVWIDDNPKWQKKQAEHQPVMPVASIEIKAGTEWSPLYIEGVPEDDNGVNFITAIVASLRGETRWTTIWMPPPIIESDPNYNNAEYRFVIRSNGGTFLSTAFTLDSARSNGGLTSIAREPALVTEKIPAGTH